MLLPNIPSVPSVSSVPTVLHVDFNLNIVGNILEATEAQFEAAGLAYGHGTDCAFDDACVLLRHAMQLPYDADLTQERWTDCVPATDYAVFLQLVQRRIQERIPTPYLTGMAYVQGVALFTDPLVIVPRSLLGELLFSGVLDTWLAYPPQRILDICTGSGAIAIQAALVYEAAHVDAIELDSTALTLARRNVLAYALEARLHLYQGDLYDALPQSAMLQYDLILSNPPYVNEVSMDALPAEYQAEPRLALAGGLDGMDIVRRIMAKATRYLTAKGVLILEIGFEAAFFEAAFPKLPFTYLPVTAGDDLIVMVLAENLYLMH